MADTSIQDKYGVKYHQFWVNEEAGTVFCLVQGPDMETCALVHRLAHGNVACAMTEVKEGMYKLAIGSHTVKSKDGLVRYESGKVDSGYRSILVVSIRGLTHAKSSEDFDLLEIPTWARQTTTDYFDKYGGRTFTLEGDDNLSAFFDSPFKALECAKSLLQNLLKGNSTKETRVIFKMGLSAGQPVNENGDFFDRVKLLTFRLCSSANDNQLLVSPLIQKLCPDLKITDMPHIRCIDKSEENFLSALHNTIEDNLSNETFTIHDLCRNIGISRPQLYRKVNSLTGRSPVNFLRDLRLEKARILLHQKTGSVAQVAYEVGFNSPSYFTHVFKQRFGTLPHAYSKAMLQ